MLEPIEHAYFNWLCTKVTEIGNRNYISLLGILYKTEFVWVIPGDSHRASEGIELREDFLREFRCESDPLWESQPCSIFEMFLALANRANFQIELGVKTWFWEFMTNLKLEEYRQISGRDEYLIADIVDTFIWRQYEPDGFGGVFPMSRTENDQRKIELWYQFCEYVNDRGLL